MLNDNKLKLIALDLAYAHTGWAVLEDENLVDYGVIETDPHQSDFDRIRELRQKLGRLFFDWGAVALSGNKTHVIVEKTDWSRGARDTRESWIKETLARESLAIAVTTAFGVCIETGITPSVYGPNEWRRELGASGKGAKETVAAHVAVVFKEHFEIVLKDRTCLVHGAMRRTVSPTVCDRRTGRQVPDHVTDAIGMGLVAYRRLQLESRIHREIQREPAET